MLSSQSSSCLQFDSLSLSFSGCCTCFCVFFLLLLLFLLPPGLTRLSNLSPGKRSVGRNCHLTRISESRWQKKCSTISHQKKRISFWDTCAQSRYPVFVVVLNHPVRCTSTIFTCNNGDGDGDGDGEGWRAKTVPNWHPKKHTTPESNFLATKLSPSILGKKWQKPHKFYF